MDPFSMPSRGLNECRILRTFRRRNLENVHGFFHGKVHAFHQIANGGGKCLLHALLHATLHAIFPCLLGTYLTCEFLVPLKIDHVKDLLLQFIGKIFR